MAVSVKPLFISLVLIVVVAFFLFELGSSIVRYKAPSGIASPETILNQPSSENTSPSQESQVYSTKDGVLGFRYPSFWDNTSGKSQSFQEFGFLDEAILFFDQSKQKQLELFTVDAQESEIDLSNFDCQMLPTLCTEIMLGQTQAIEVSLPNQDESSRAIFIPYKDKLFILNFSLNVSDADYAQIIESIVLK